MQTEHKLNNPNGHVSEDQLTVNLIPPEIEPHLGEPPLICGETREDYDALFTQLVLKVEPLDIIEWIWVKDVLDLIWEAKRLRNLKAALLRSETYKSSERILGEVIEGLIEDADYYSSKKIARQLAIGWTEKNTQKTQDLKGLLAKAGHDIHTVTSDALTKRLYDIERIEKMIASCDKRRDDVLREIERSRENLAKRIKEQAQQLIEDIEVEPTPSPLD